MEGSNPNVKPPSEGYARYVLAVLVLVYMFNFIDRQILTILAEDIKRDLDLTDSDLGFLYGTAFGVFYSLFGIPLGKLADSWHRVRLMTIGLALWSLMTALSGLSKNFGQLATARIGVGVGEATASPCAYSLIADYFPAQRRATALAIYTSGLYLGGGLSLFIGGRIVRTWNEAFPGGSGPFGLVGWQAAFMAVGLPGLLLALWVSTLREPLRGQSEGLITPPVPEPFKGFLGELVSIIPPLTLIGAGQRGGKALAINFAALILALAAAHGLFKLTGDGKQWYAVCLGVYAVFSWASALRRRDPPTFKLIWGTPAFIYVTVGYGLVTFLAYSVNAFSAAYAIRTFHLPQDQVGFWLGGANAAGGALGVIIGGWFADHLYKTNPAGRIIVIMIGAVGPVLPFVLSFTTENESLYFALNGPIVLLSSMALGAAGASAISLVLPRMRGTATASFVFGTALIGLSLGPYFAGKISTVTGDLATGMLSLLAAVPISVMCLVMAYKLVPKAEASLIDRARAAGEPI